MVQVPAAQLIYTHVEREESPRDIGGFQTLFYTHALLAEAEVREIEGRLLYLGPDDGPPKRLFFPTATGKCVVAQVVPLLEPDRLGRGGRYLAHALVLSAADFARSGADPWPILEDFSFASTMAAVGEQGNVRSGDIPAAMLELSAAVPPKSLTQDRADTVLGDRHTVQGAASSGGPLSWPAAELAKLALLALRAPALAQQRAAVAFIGGAAQIAASLAAALVAVPVVLRAHCSFDTYFVQGNLVATYFWAIGLPDNPGRSNLMVVDAAGRRVLRSSAVSPETAYERWVVPVLSAGRLEEVVASREPAYALATWLKGHAVDAAVLEAVSPDLVGEMFRLNPQLVQARLHGWLEKRLPPVLAARLFEALAQQLPPMDLFLGIRRGFEFSLLLELLVQVYTELGWRAPPRNELRALDDLLRGVQHPLLGVLLAAWTGQRQTLRRRLEDLDDEAYRYFSERALTTGLVAPLDLAAAGHGESLTALYLATVEERRQNLVALVKVLLVVGEAEALGALVPHLAGRPRRALKKLARFLRHQQGVPAALQEGVEEALER